MGIRHIMSFLGYCILAVVLNIIAIETQSQLVAIFFWLMIALTIFNIFRAISWGFHFYLSKKPQYKVVLLRYFMNTFIPKEFFRVMAHDRREENDVKNAPIVLFGISLISYYIKQETDLLLFSIIFWITLILSIIYFLIIYYDAGEEELQDLSYDEPIGIFKILGFSISLWFFFIGVSGFKTIQNDSMVKYAEALFVESKEYIVSAFNTSSNNSEHYDEDDEPYIHSHTGRE